MSEGKKESGDKRSEGTNVFRRAWSWLHVALGFTSEAAQIKAIIGLIVLVVFSVSLFFVSYSLARHKRMVARLTAQVTLLQAEVKFRDLQLKRKAEELELVKLRTKNETHSKKREQIRKRIKALNRDVQQEKRKLDERRKSIRDRDSLDDLLKRAKQLTRDTL